MMSESDVATTDVHDLVVDADLVQVFPVDGKQPPGNGGRVQGLWLWLWLWGSGAMTMGLWGDGYNYGAMVMAAGMAKTSKHGEDPRPRQGRESCTSIRTYQGLGASGRLAWGFEYKRKFPL